ncbi:MAG: hypothetical protein JWR15_2452, partial [Prosthecobacter sp.]|nr:hypothetical protein [Prosthecobacter sp.]
MTTLIIRGLALLLLVSATTLHAQVPQFLNYQGRVAVGSSNFDGTGQFKFALVNANGSTTYWSNDGSSTAGSEPATAVALTVSKGLYSVQLGDTTLPNMTAVPFGVFANADVRLRVWFDDGVNGSQMLAPDQRIAAVGYSLITAGVNLPVTTSATAGVIGQNGSPLIHSFGTSNFFAGASSGNFALTGSDNAAVGLGTLSAITTGHKNVAIGSAALAANTTGLANTAAGYNALSQTTVGNQNTANGAYALSTNDSGSNNTASGYAALQYNTSGSSNTALGWQAMTDNTTGGNNIAVGRRAGQNLTTGSNNIDIGHSGVAGESNIIRIGDGSTQTDTYLTGVVHGNGSALTGITATSLASGSVTSTQIASGAVGSTQLASGLTLGGTTTGTFSGSLAGNASTATSAVSFSGSLAGNVTGTQSATVVATVGGVTAANVASGANLANAATSANTVSTIVKRDASGNFSAGTLTVAGRITLPTTSSSTVGVITQNGSTLISTYGLSN